MARDGFAEIALAELAESLPVRRRGIVCTAFVEPSTAPQIVVRPARPLRNRLFEAGSLTKTLTATLLATLVLDGRVHLNTAVGDILGSEGGGANDVTMLELATHTSGLPRLAPNSITFPFWPRDPYRFYGRGKLGKGLAEIALPTRGEVEYSNLGFDLLGCCLSAAANQDFNALLRERVLVPAGMDTARCQPCSRRGLVRGHGSLLLGGKRWHQPLSAAGGVDCAIDDLAKWLAANVDPRSTPLEDAIRMSHRVHVTSSKGSVGLAWQISNGLIWHNGATGSFQAYLGFQPGVAGVATLSNVGVSRRHQHDLQAGTWLRNRLPR